MQHYQKSYPKSLPASLSCYLQLCLFFPSKESSTHSTSHREVQPLHTGPLPLPRGVDGEEKKKGNRTLGRLILWNRKLNDLWRMWRRDGHTNMYGSRGWEQKSTALDLPTEARTSFQEPHLLSKGSWHRKKPMLHSSQVNPRTSQFSDVLLRQQWSPSGVGTRLTLVFLQGTAGQRDQSVAWDRESSTPGWS